MPDNFPVGMRVKCQEDCWWYQKTPKGWEKAYIRTCINGIDIQGYAKILPKNAPGFCSGFLMSTADGCYCNAGTNKSCHFINMLDMI